METLEEKIVRRLQKDGMTITTAESCTGGLLAGRILNVSGASDVYEEGYITYANRSKQSILGVSEQSLEKYGAVSSQVAEEMAIGAAKAANADVALSTTGIAGPTGGTEEKPVGLIYIGCYYFEKVEIRELHLAGTREENRQNAVTEALRLLDSVMENRKK